MVIVRNKNKVKLCKDSDAWVLYLVGWSGGLLEGNICMQRARGSDISRMNKSCLKHFTD